MDRPTLDNWMRPPHPFWSFRHVRELIPTSRIRHGRHPRALPFEAVGDLLDLRELLRQLGGEGLVVAHHQRGLAVARYEIRHGEGFPGTGHT